MTKKLSANKGKSRYGSRLIHNGKLCEAAIIDDLVWEGGTKEEILSAFMEKITHRTNEKKAWKRIEDHFRHLREKHGLTTRPNPNKDFYKTDKEYAE